MYKNAEFHIFIYKIHMLNFFKSKSSSVENMNILNIIEHFTDWKLIDKQRRC